MTQLREVQHWLSDDELRRIYTASYWNDIEQEKKKEWWIEDGNYERCQLHLERSRLMSEYRQAELFIRELPGHELKIADLAAGIGWTAALLSKVGNVAEVHAVEISNHRLERLFPHSIAMFNGRPEKISRYLGSFYDLKLSNESMDAIFLSQALHHADRPLRLMMECDRVLKPGGRIIVVGEHGIGLRRLIKRFVKVALCDRRIETNFQNLFPPDTLLGDHYYRISDYYFLFSAMGYKTKHRIAATGQTMFVADKCG